jgi:predicted porin
MQKKLMTMAVAGALGALGSTGALAQASSVQIYGTISVALEGAQAKGADQQLVGTSSWRNAAGVATGIGGVFSATPANKDARARVISSGSNFGLRGREDLGSGLYAGFQAEAAITLGGNSAQSSGTGGTVATWRNTGVWVGGNTWGEVGWGMWDTPYNINMGLAPAHAAYANASTTMVAGLLGTVPQGGGTISGYTVDAQCNPNFVVAAATTTVPNQTFGNTAATCFNWATSFHRRVSNSFWYQSPSWAGFRARLHYGAEGNQTPPSSETGTGVGGKLHPNLYGAGVSYTLGGFYGGIGFENHTDYIATAARTYGGLTLGGNLAALSLANIPIGVTGVSGSSDNAWNLNLRYTFAFGLTIGGYAETLKYKIDYNAGAPASALTEMKKQGYRLDVAYQIGPHTIGAQYGWATQMKCTTVAIGCDSSDTDATTWILGYAYSLSKRTSLTAYLTWVQNEANAAYNGIVFYGIGPASGADPRYFGLGMRHTF